MSSLTTKYAIPFPVAADAVSAEPTTLAALANRLDLLLGESGVWSPSMTAGVTSSTAIALSRTYPGNAAGSTPGIVIVQYQTPMSSGVIVQHWVATWTGTATTVTGFTLNAISSTTTGRTFIWRFLPVL